MRAALYYIFKKNLPVLFVVVILIAGFKWITAFNTPSIRPGDATLDTWVAQCKDMSAEQLEQFVEALNTRAYTEKKIDSAEVSAYSNFISSYRNRIHIQKLIDFAEKKEGALPTDLPDNYMQLLDFYKALPTPEIMNEQPLDVYFDLQSYSLVFLAVTLLAAVFFGQQYETDMYTYTATARYGRRYTGTIHLALCLIGTVLLLANEVFDLIYSGIFAGSSVLAAPLQSYSPFSGAQIAISIGQGLLILFFSKLLGLLLMCYLVKRTAHHQKNIKDTLVYSVCFILAVFFLGKALANTKYFCLVQFGYVDWKEILARTTRFVSIGISSLEMGLILLALLGIGLPVAGWLYRLLARRHIERRR